MLVRVIVLALVFLLFSACAGNEDKKTYTLDNSSLRQFKGNEELVFEVNGTFLSGAITTQFSDDVTIDWNTSAETRHPQRDVPLDGLLVESFLLNAPNVPQEKVKRHYAQDANGSLFLYAMELGDQGLVWILPKNDSEPLGIEVVRSPLPDTSVAAVYDIWQCTSVGACEKVGYGTEEFNYVRVENVSTPYANFETYRFAYFMQLNSTKASFDVSDYQQIFGVTWIYPGLGPVRINRYRNGDSQTELNGFLVSTNVKLDEN